MTQAIAARALGIGERRLRELETRSLPVPAGIAETVARMTAPACASLPTLDPDPSMTAKVFQEWARRLPSGTEPLAAGILGITSRAFWYLRDSADPATAIPRRVASIVRNLLPAGSGRYLGRDLKTWRERHGLSLHDAASILAQPVERLATAEREHYRNLPPALEAALACLDTL
jgi:hypothetical protein